MSLQTFNRDIVPLLQLILSFIGAASLYLLWWQIKQTSQWNKLQAQSAFHSDAHSHFKALLRCGRKVGVDLKARTTPLTREELQKLWDDDDSYEALVEFINSLEALSAKVRMGIIDRDAAFSSHGILIMNSFKVYGLAVETFRQKYHEDALLEWQKLSEEWNDLDDRTQQERKIDEKLRNQKKGLAPKV